MLLQKIIFKKTTHLNSTKHHKTVCIDWIYQGKIIVEINLPSQIDVTVLRIFKKWKLLKHQFYKDLLFKRRYTEKSYNTSVLNIEQQPYSFNVFLVQR